MGSACSCVAGQREEVKPAGVGREAAAAGADAKHSAAVHVGTKENTELVPMRAAPNGESISAEGGNPATSSSAPEPERQGSVVLGAKGGETVSVQAKMAQEGTLAVDPGPSTIVIVMGASVRLYVLTCASGNGNMQTRAVVDYCVAVRFKYLWRYCMGWREGQWVGDYVCRRLVGRKLTNKLLTPCSVSWIHT